MEETQHLTQKQQYGDGNLSGYPPKQLDQSGNPSGNQSGYGPAAGKTVVMKKKDPHIPAAPILLLWSLLFSFCFMGSASVTAVYLNAELGFSEPVTEFMTNAFMAFNFGSGLIGGFFADALLGKFRIAVLGSGFGFFGGLLLTFAQLTDISDDLMFGFSFGGFFLVYFGVGTMYPVVSTLLADQFQPDQVQERSLYFSWSYWSFQAGSILATLSIPFAFDWSPLWGFAILTLVWMITLCVLVFPSFYYQINPAEGPAVFTSFFRVLCGCDAAPRTHAAGYAEIDESGPVVIKGIATPDAQARNDVKQVITALLLLLPLILFWAVFFQTQSVWIFLASQMDSKIFGIDIPPNETISLNPIFDVLIIPIAAKIVYPFFEKIGMPLRAIRKMVLGILFIFIAVMSAGILQLLLFYHWKLSIAWMIVPYFWLSMADVFLSVTAYEFCYTQAPYHLTTIMAAAWLAIIALGNILTAVAGFITFSNPSFNYFMYGGAMIVVLIVFTILGYRYKYAEDCQTEEQKEEKLEETPSFPSYNNPNNMSINDEANLQRW